MRIVSLPALLVTSTLMAMVPAHAESLAMPAASGAAASMNTPARGITMTKVEAKFGAPTERHAAVGIPPITRWDYPGFSVFFEHDHVIHSVIK